MKRAAVYIRTSTELQGQKASPEMQEQDCRALAEREGLEVVHVFSDTERYRSGGRLVEPCPVMTLRCFQHVDATRTIRI